MMLLYLSLILCLLQNQAYWHRLVAAIVIAVATTHESHIG